MQRHAKKTVFSTDNIKNIAEKHRMYVFSSMSNLFLVHTPPSQMKYADMRFENPKIADILQEIPTHTIHKTAKQATRQPVEGGYAHD